MFVTVEALEIYRDIHRQIIESNPSRNDTMSVVISMTAENLSLLIRANDFDLIPGNSVLFEKDQLPITEYGEKLVKLGAKVSLTLSNPTNVYQTWDELLSNQDNRLAVPAHFMVINDGYCIYSHDDNHTLINAYRVIVKLIDYLKFAADHENSATSLVYLGRGKLTVDIIYDKSALDSLNSTNFGLFIDTMQEPEHTTQKKYIFQEVLFNMLLQVIQKERFESLLKRLQEFLIQFEHGYRLFVTSFSFDNVRREYEEKYREYNGKLNTSINEVATKALATPITLLFSISNISVTSTAISNYAIAISSILVSTFMLFLLRSNADNLQAIKEEYTNLFQRLALELATNKGDELGNKNDVEKLKFKLDKRVSASQNLHKITMVSAIASSAFVICYLFWLAW